MNWGDFMFRCVCFLRAPSLLPFLLCSLLFFQGGCKNSPTEPEFKNPREYTWTATQLQYPGAYNLSMYSIWGSRPTDVYVSGFSILGGQKGAMFQYDGKQWTSVSLPSPDYNYLWDMTGFGANDIWVAGSRLFVDARLDSAVVLHYDGSGWKQMLPSHMGVRGLRAVWGTSSRNLFFGSRDGKVIGSDGMSWSVDTLYLGLSINAIGGDEARAFTVGNTWKGTLDDSVMCFVRNEKSWSVLDVQFRTQSDVAPRFGVSSVYSPVSGMYYSSGFSAIFRWQTDKWVKVFSLPAEFVRLSGTGDNNILAVGWRDGPFIEHWDGAT